MDKIWGNSGKQYKSVVILGGICLQQSSVWVGNTMSRARCHLRNFPPSRPFFQGRGKLRFAGVVGTGLVRMVAVRTLRYFKIETKWHNCWRSCLFPKYQGFGICGWFVSCLQCWICVCVLCNVCVCEYLYFYMCYISSGWMLPIAMPVVMDFEALRFVEILIPTGFSAMDDDRDRSKTICLVTTLYEHMKTEYCLCWSGQNIVIGLFFSTEMIGVQESSRPWINHQVHPKS